MIPETDFEVYCVIRFSFSDDPPLFHTLIYNFKENIRYSKAILYPKKAHLVYIAKIKSIIGSKSFETVCNNLYSVRSILIQFQTLSITIISFRQNITSFFLINFYIYKKTFFRSLYKKIPTTRAGIPILFYYIRQQCGMSCSLDRYSKLSLMLRTCTGNSSRQNLTSLRNKLL